MTELFKEDRLDAWFDGSAVCVVAVGTHGDPLDLSEDKARAFMAKIQKAIAASEAS
ncbi:hypothetical protein ABT364_03315 [Massilia sp. SR12]